MNIILYVFQKYFYQYRPEAERTSYGDISDRLAIRKRLECKSFEWFLTNIYPEQVILLVNVLNINIH
jgi:polypeptide N-acetylgalactosaminyltransferase